MTLSSRILTACATLALACAAAAPLSAQEAMPPAVSHELEGRDQCLMCHTGAMEGVPAAPASHEGRTNEVCLWCHAPDSPMLTTQPPAIPHGLEGQTECMMCHSGAMQGIPGTPESHEGRGNETCQMCHTAAG